VAEKIVINLPRQNEAVNLYLLYCVYRYHCGDFSAIHETTKKESAEEEAGYWYKFNSKFYGTVWTVHVAQNIPWTPIFHR